MINRSILKVGDSFSAAVYPCTGKLPGKVVYIHPKKHFFIVEFTAENGSKIRESFTYLGPLTPNDPIR